MAKKIKKNAENFSFSYDIAESIVNYARKVLQEALGEISVYEMVDIFTSHHPVSHMTS
jgi:hypothetical protein